MSLETGFYMGLLAIVLGAAAITAVVVYLAAHEQTKNNHLNT